MNSSKTKVGRCLKTKLRVANTRTIDAVIEMKFVLIIDNIEAIY